MLKIDLNKQISKTFKPVLYNILNFKVHKVIMKGGRASFKSAVAVMAIIIGVLVNKCSALCFVKTDSSSQDKLANNFLKYMRILGVEHRFKYVKVNSRFIILDEDGNPTNEVIRLKGAMNTDDVKSMTTDTPEGYGYTFVEEATLFKTENDVDSLYSTAMRGTGKHCFILVYNPPMETDNHLNKRYANKPCGIDLGYEKAYCYDVEPMSTEMAQATGLDNSIVMIHHSTYLDAVRDGFGEFIAYNIVEYERQRKENHRAWEWDKLGMVVGTDANVFWNIKDYTYTDNLSTEIKTVLFKYGIDCSNGGKDPWCVMKCLWKPSTQDIYIIDERIIQGTLQLNDIVNNKYKEVADAWIKINPLNKTGYGDSAVPNNIVGVRNQQVNVKGYLQNPNVYPAKKNRQYSKTRSVMFLQNLNGIYIDAKRTPIAYSEFKNYRYKIDKAGNITTELQDGNDHCIDAVIYSLVDVIPFN